MTGEPSLLIDDGGRAEAPARPRVVVMGVSACGKSTVASRLAILLGAPFVDADDLHPAANVAKMTAGVPLDDDDRGPWLDEVAAALGRADRPVIACSALKRVYRDRLRRAGASVTFLHLTGSEHVLAARAVRRAGHFMPPQLLRSQLDTLEPLSADEHGFAIDVDRSIDEIVFSARDWLNARDRA